MPKKPGKKKKSTSSSSKASKTRSKKGANRGVNLRKTKSRKRQESATAGFEVRLSINVSKCPDRDRKAIALMGKVRVNNGQSNGRRVTTMDIDNAAKRLSRGTNNGQIAYLLDALGHEQRIRILLKLLGGEATHKMLSKETGLKAGPLYHHIRELRTAGLVGPKVRDLYTLTRKGRRAIMSAMAIGKACA